MGIIIGVPGPYLGSSQKGKGIKLPVLSNVQVTDIIDVSATISGIIITNGYETTIEIQYGSTPSLGSTLTPVGSPFAKSKDPVAFSVGLTGLLPYSWVFYRIVVTTSKGLVATPVYHFNTLEPVELSDGNWAAMYDFAGEHNVVLSGSVQQLRDNSQGNELGPELITNGDFSNGQTGWRLRAGKIFVEDGVMKFIIGTTGDYDSTWFGNDSNSNAFRPTRMIVTTVKASPASLSRLGLSPTPERITTVGTFTQDAISTNYLGQIGLGGAITDAEVSFISQKFVLGNHLVQSNASYQPSAKLDSYGFNGSSQRMRTHNQFGTLGTVYAILKRPADEDFDIQNDLTNLGDFANGIFYLGSNSAYATFYEFDLKFMWVRNVTDSQDTIDKLNEWFMRENKEMPPLTVGVLGTGIWDDSAFWADDVPWNDGV